MVPHIQSSKHSMRLTGVRGAEYTPQKLDAPFPVSPAAISPALLPDSLARASQPQQGTLSLTCEWI